MSYCPEQLPEFPSLLRPKNEVEGTCEKASAETENGGLPVENAGAAKKGLHAKKEVSPYSYFTSSF